MCGVIAFQCLESLSVSNISWAIYLLQGAGIPHSVHRRIIVKQGPHRVAFLPQWHG